MAGIAAPFVFPDSDAAFASLFIGLVVFFTALIVFFMFSTRAKGVSDKFLDENLLAHWHLEEGELKVYREGLYYQDEIIYFKPPYCFLEGVGYDPTDARQLIFLYRAMGGRNMRSRRNLISVTIPLGYEPSAQFVIDSFKCPLPQDYLRRLQDKDPFDDEDDQVDDEA